MANRRPQPVAQQQEDGRTVAPIRGIDGVQQVRAPDIGRMPTQAPLPVATGEAEMFQAQAQVFSGLSEKIGQIADHAAIKEGDLEGKLAGMDQEFRPGRSLTLYGEAYDKAGIDTFKRNMVTNVTAQMNAAFDKHQDDPKALSGALEKVRAGWKDNLFPEVQPEFEALYNREKLGHERQATRNHAARVTAEQKAALEGEMQARIKSLDQLAYRAGLDPTADQALSGAVLEMQRSLSVKGPDGRPLVNPATAKKMLIEAQEQVAYSRIVGAFSRTEGADGKARFIEDIQAKFQSGKDPMLNSFDVRSYERLTSHLRAELSRETTKANQQTAMLRRDVSGFVERAKDGIPLTPADDAALRAKVAASGSPELAELYNEGRASLSIVGELNSRPLPAVEAWVDRERQRQVTQGVTSGREYDRLKLAEGWLQKSHAAVAKDMLGHAQKTGMDIPDLDLRSPDTLAQTLPARIAAAETAAQHFGRGVQYFKPQERAALASVAQLGGAAVASTAASIVRSAGTEAPKVLEEIVKDAPELAALGGLIVENGDPQAQADAAAGFALRQNPDYNKHRKIGGAKDVEPVISSTYGSAFMALGNAKTPVVELANAIYEARATRKNLPAFDPKLYGEALSQAAGEIEVDGVKFGGITSHNNGYFGMWSRKVIVPHEIRQDSFDDVIGLITDEDLAATGQRFTTAKGEALTADQIKKRGTLVSVGAGRYYVAMGNPDTAPMWASDGKGREAVLDIRALIPRLRERDKSLFFGAK